MGWKRVVETWPRRAGKTAAASKFIGHDWEGRPTYLQANGKVTLGDGSPAPTSSRGAHELRWEVGPGAAMIDLGPAEHRVRRLDRKTRKMLNDQVLAGAHVHVWDLSRQRWLCWSGECSAGSGSAWWNAL